jgi:sigma-B regulation protein RsbU (phosphoserine phosphatase)
MAVMTGVPLPLRESPLERLRERELEEARSLQQAIIQVDPLRAPAIEFASRFRPYVDVGGDFLDYFRLSDDRLGLYLGDVVGKGLPAAMYAALAVGTMRGIKKTGELPREVLELLNRRLRMRVPPARYCAVQYAVFDPASLELWLANAGLPKPVHIATHGCSELGEGGLPSGLFPDTQYEQVSVQLKAGDAVLFLTDGILEAQNAAFEEFGNERLLEVCETLRGESADRILARLFEAVDGFVAGAQQHDDMTAAVMKLA